MASPPVTPNKKRCAVCAEEKGRTAFIKDGDLCTKCRNTETNPLCLKRGSPSVWSSALPASPSSRVVPDRRPDQYMGGPGASIRSSPPVLQHSNSRLPNSPHSEEKSLSVKSTPHGGSLNTKTLEHKIDLILESALEMERNQIQVAAIRTEMHKFLVELSHVNNNVAAEDDEKYSGLESLTVTIEQRFLSTRREILTLQETISGLRNEIHQQHVAVEETWQVKTARREQIWIDRLTEERRIWHERMLEERKQWQQSLEQQNAELQNTLQEGISQLRQESQRSDTERLSVIQNRTSESPKIVGDPAAHGGHPSLCEGSAVINTQTSSLQSKVPGGGATSHSSATSADPVSRTPISLKPKPPNIIIKRSVVQI